MYAPVLHEVVIDVQPVGKEHGLPRVAQEGIIVVAALPQPGWVKNRFQCHLTQDQLLE